MNGLSGCCEIWLSPAVSLEKGFHAVLMQEKVELLFHLEERGGNTINLGYYFELESASDVVC